VLLIRNGLPPGSLILGQLSFTNIKITLETPGGPLGGEVTDAIADAHFVMRGTGAFAGYSRTLDITVAMRFVAGPQIPPTSVRAFALYVDQIQGQIVADIDFDLLRITAGNSFGLPSPGHAVMSQDGSGDWLTDSFFDLSYRIDFVGRPGGPFTGLSGSTTSEHRQRAGVFTNRICNVPDNGFGTAEWTPFCAGWVTKTEGLIYGNGEGTFLIANLVRTPPGGLTIAGGGPYGGEQTNDTETLAADIFGEGALAGFHRLVSMPFASQHDLGPEMTLAPFQGRISEGSSLFGQLAPGDPDFDLLRFVGGTAYGLASAGHTSLTSSTGPNWAVDSFFDITYRVDVVGAPASPLAGLSGTNDADTRAQAGRERPGFCLVPDNGTGTTNFPPMCASGYRGPRHARGLLIAASPGSPVLVDVEIVPLALVSVLPGGPLGGATQEWQAKIRLDLTGVGFWGGYTRSISIAGTAKTATGPITLGSNPQHFETDLLELQAQLVGDIEFDLLRITGGTNFGLPSPGYTTFTSAGGGDWNVDSFFDITYRLDFVGAGTGIFAGQSASTMDRQRHVNGDIPWLAAPPRGSSAAVALSLAAPNPTRAGASVTLELPRRAAVRVSVHDVAGRIVRIVEDSTREAGTHRLAWDGAGVSGARARPGLYLLRVDADGLRFTRRVVITG
jgi:hypothetical protein